ncbi:DUF3782 domain-containing protein [Gammaproteobacteria bacterium]
MTTTQPTLDDVWQLFHETARRFQETDRKFQETDRKFQDTDRKFQDTDRKFQDTDRKFQETDRKFQDTDRKFQDTDRILKERSVETDRFLKERSAETDRILRERSTEFDRRMKELSKRLGDIGNRLGEFVEHMVEPTVVKLFQAEGVEVHEVHSGVCVERNGEGIEIDLLVVNDGAVVAVECKSKLTREHVDAHALRMEKLKRMLPAYRHHQAFGAVAGMVVSADIAQYAEQQGFYVLAQSGESIEVRNHVNFRAKAW